MVHLAVDFRQHVAVVAHQVGLHLQAERQIAAVTSLGDLPQPVDRLRQVLPRIAPPRRIEGKAAQQLRLQGMGQVARLLHVAGQILLDRHVGVLRAVLHVQQLDLADGRAERRDVQLVFILKLPDLLDLGQGELHGVLHPAAHVDEADAVVLQAQGGHGRKLLDRRPMIGGLVGKRGENHAGAVVHEGPRRIAGVGSKRPL